MKHILLGLSLGLTSGWLATAPSVWWLLPLVVGVLLAILFGLIEQLYGQRRYRWFVVLLVTMSGLMSALHVLTMERSWIIALILPGMIIAMVAWFYLATWGWGTYTTHHAIPPLWRPGWVGKLARTMRWVGAVSFASTVLLGGLVLVQPDLDTTRFLIVLTISSVLVRAILHDPFTIRGVIRLPRMRTP